VPGCAHADLPPGFGDGHVRDLPRPLTQLPRTRLPF